MNSLTKTNIPVQTQKKSFIIPYFITAENRSTTIADNLLVIERFQMLKYIFSLNTGNSQNVSFLYRYKIFRACLIFKVVE